MRAFGQEYLDYKRRTGAFCPCAALDCGVPDPEAQSLLGLTQTSH